VYGTRKGLTNIRFRECMECKYKFMTKEVLSEDLLSHDYNNYLQEIGEITPGERERVQSEK
jgi:hypothetical protein